jgi:hypothetical protein
VLRVRVVDENRVDEVRNQLGSTVHLPWSKDALEQRRFDGSKPVSA